MARSFVVPEVKETGNSEDVNDYISVEVKNPELCPRYTARVVKNIKIAPSPEWMQRRLASVGIRPYKQYRRYNKLCYGGVCTAYARI